MKLNDIYKLAIKKGIENDPRGTTRIKKLLKDCKTDYKKMSIEEKDKISPDSLFNPYSDTRVLYGSPDCQVKNAILVGIDIKCGEILLAHHLRKKGTKVDLVLAHHPVGLAISKLYDVMNMQKDILFDLGVPINISQGITEEKIGEIERLIMPLNVNRDIDMAEILDIPYMCVHTPADNMVAEYLQDIFDKEKPETLSDITDILHEIPEFRYSTRKHMPPQLFVGNKKSKCGKVVVDMTGGTEGSDKAFRYLAHAGVGTIVGMHVSEKFRLAAKENYINVVIAGHIASDTLGMNLFLDEVLKKVELDIIECSGFYRVDRRGKIKKASMMSKKLKQKDLDGKYFK